jgi:hypothetical protein
VLGVRISALVTSTLTLAAGAHVAGAGHLLEAPELLAVVTVLTCLAHLIAQSRVSGLALMGCVGVLQWLTHLAFGALSSSHCSGAAAWTVSGHATHSLHAAVPVVRFAEASCAAATTTGAMTVASTVVSESVVSALVSSSGPMILAHVLAAVVTTRVLDGFERLLLNLWSWLSPLPAVPVVFARAIHPRPRVLAEAFLLPLYPVEILRHHRRRGPPLVQWPVTSAQTVVRSGYVFLRS